ncbi:MAG: permease [Armatimonadetes bacterium]|nr:permease [Armatimonadota bacterium]
MDSKLLAIVDVFRCCIFTPRVLTTVLPAFVLAGAISAFVPRQAVLKYLGPGAKRIWAYLVSAISGVVLSVCSCNVVPLFVSIYRHGAGLGPAVTFLYAGPAINVVAIIFTFQVIGWGMGTWRAIGTPLLGILAGIIMARLYAREERRRAAELTAEIVATQTNGGTEELDQVQLRHALVVLAFLLAAVIVGALHMPWYYQAPGMVAAFGGAVLAALKLTDAERVREWGAETWSFAKTVIPILVPVILLIGALAAYIDIKYVYRLVGGNSPRYIASAAAFGTLMYFPILSEVAFTKAFLKLGMATGPAMAILYTGSGLSLPGAIALSRYIGWKKTVLYLMVMMVLATGAAMLFASEIGQYLCPCKMDGTAAEAAK